jgi:hypothetical protein
MSTYLTLAFAALLALNWRAKAGGGDPILAPGIE